MGGVAEIYTDMSLTMEQDHPNWVAECAKCDMSRLFVSLYAIQYLLEPILCHSDHIV